MFESGVSGVGALAASLGIGLIQKPLGDDYIELLKNPRYGFGSAVNPCIDCRIYMMRMAKRLMEELGASFVVSGEVLGQRPMSQKRVDFDRVEKDSGLAGRLLRPLSAKLLPPTVVEQDGTVDREKLFAISGRSRVELLAMAKRFGISETPSPSSGCRLTEKTFAPRLYDLWRLSPEAGRWCYEILNVGRHIRIDSHRKIVIGRNETENAMIKSFAVREDRPDIALVEPESFLGPDALLYGRVDEKGIELAAALIVGYSRRADPKLSVPLVRVTDAGGTHIVSVERQFTGSDFKLL